MFHEINVICVNLIRNKIEVFDNIVTMRDHKKGSCK